MILMNKRKKISREIYIPHKKLICDWTDERRYLIKYRTLKFYLRYCMVVEKV